MSSSSAVDLSASRGVSCRNLSKNQGLERLGEWNLFLEAIAEQIRYSTATVTCEILRYVSTHMV